MPYKKTASLKGVMYTWVRSEFKKCSLKLRVIQNQDLPLRMHKVLYKLIRVVSRVRSEVIVGRPSHLQVCDPSNTLRLVIIAFHTSKLWEVRWGAESSQ